MWCVRMRLERFGGDRGTTVHFVQLTASVTDEVWVVKERGWMGVARVFLVGVTYKCMHVDIYESGCICVVGFVWVWVRVRARVCVCACVFGGSGFRDRRKIIVVREWEKLWVLTCRSWLQHISFQIISGANVECSNLTLWCHSVT